MLDEFIEVNKVDAQIVSFLDETDEVGALRSERLAKSIFVAVKFFVTPDRDTFLAVFPAEKRLDEEKLKKLSGEEEAVEAEAEDTFEWIGYKKGLLPPISIYEIKVFVDTSLKDKSMFCRLGPKDYLKLSFDAIVEANDEVVVKKITR